MLVLKYKHKQNKQIDRVQTSELNNIPKQIKGTKETNKLFWAHTCFVKYYLKKNLNLKKSKKNNKYDFFFNPKKTKKN